jgi:FlaA1/EpsC-like NDP-sugar epimerase
METSFNNKRVLVTGACGTVGRELIRQLLEGSRVEEIIALDNNESDLFFLEQEFCVRNRVQFFLADIRDREKLSRKMKGIHIVFHTAAFKHVILCERSPFEAVQTNILGVQNVVLAATENAVEKVIFTSSDKAVNPTNVMGTSKLMGERLMTAANEDFRRNGPIFASTRFGNVLGSRGSVMPIFREQIRRGGPVTLTHPEMTRFIMTVEESAQLVLASASLARGGEVFITKMPSIRVEDLAEVMIETLAPVYGYLPARIEVKVIGTKPGEKMYEELMSLEETRRAWELDEYFIVLPAFTSCHRDATYTYSKIRSRNVTNPYHSGNEAPLSKAELLTLLKNNNLIFEDMSHKEHPAERYWPNGGCLEPLPMVRVGF